ncbi:MAG: hypothetical protein DYG94_14950 [Leptolyngbya sp. PLA3]|nr:MAG: hypothetical protein EDM82_15275 [Cyanobacteria bacterium CYA]MCE7970026.1 hypothetical protein [Leptolyngbya sp. PL-A3]
MAEPMDASTWNAARRLRRRRGCLLLVVLPLGVVSIMFAWAGLRLFDKPTVSRNFTAEFNARFESIPDDQKAWPLLKQAIIERVAAQPADDLRLNWPTYPGGPMWAESAAHLDQLQPTLEKVRQAAAKPYLGRELSDRIDPEIAKAEAKAYGRPYVPDPPGDENPMMIDVLLPDLSYMRRFAQDLSVDTYMAAEVGQGERAMRNFEATLGLAHLTGESETLIGQLVQIAIEGLAERQLAQVLSNYPNLFNIDQLARLQHAFMSVGRPAPAPPEGLTRYDLNMTMERTFFYDMVQRSFSDDGHGNGHMTLEGARLFNLINSNSDSHGDNFAGVAAALLSASRKETVQKYDDLMSRFEDAAAKRPWQRRPGELLLDSEIEELRTSRFGQARYPLITLLMPALERVALTKDLADARRDAAIASIALARYFADHQHYPATLADLLTDYLPALPLDPVDGQPLRYLLTPTGPVLYSLGFDEDDDQGRPSADPDHAQPLTRSDSRTDTDGDWILYPADMPTPEPEE